MVKSLNNVSTEINVAVPKEVPIKRTTPGETIDFEKVNIHMASTLFMDPKAARHMNPSDFYWMDESNILYMRSVREIDYVPDHGLIILTNPHFEAMWDIKAKDLTQLSDEGTDSRTRKSNK